MENETPWHLARYSQHSKFAIRRMLSFWRQCVLRGDVSVFRGLGAIIIIGAAK